MRQRIWLHLCWAALAACGCAEPFVFLGNDVTDFAVAGAAADDHAADGNGASGGAESFRVSGSVGRGEYKLFELGSAEAGDEWTISVPFGARGDLIAVLLDANDNLLMREYVSLGQPLRHVMRESTSRTRLGVMLSTSGVAGGFSLDVAVRRAVGAPAPRPQVVWLNFGSAADVRVHRRDNLSFSAFDAAVLGESYVGQTQAIKDAIVRAVREDYQDYNIEIRTSDEGPQPAGSVTVLHFGSYDSSLLGLADEVDNYNATLSQNAIIFIQSFAVYQTMLLSPEEMGVMIANVASHELGHLLGLYHTKDVTDVMDTTGTAWDLAANQGFARAALDPSVFPTGWEDSPTLLEQTLGVSEAAAKGLSAARIMKRPELLWARQFAQSEIPHTCGTCIDPDRP